jgi:hypothetical protein
MRLDANRSFEQYSREPAHPMNSQPMPPDAPDAELPEVDLRQELERRAPIYTLVRLNPIATRRWKARYRIMLAADYLDAQSAAETYARALLAALDAGDSASAPPEAPNTPTNP